MEKTCEKHTKYLGYLLIKLVILRERVKSKHVWCAAWPFHATSQLSISSELPSLNSIAVACLVATHAFCSWSLIQEGRFTSMKIQLLADC